MHTLSGLIEPTVYNGIIYASERGENYITSKQSQPLVIYPRDLYLEVMDKSKVKRNEIFFDFCLVLPSNKSEE